MSEVEFHEVEAEHTDHGMMLAHFIQLPNEETWVFEEQESMFETEDEDALAELVRLASGELRNQRDDVDSIITPYTDD